MNYDAIVVLGSYVEDDGSLDRTGRSRMNKAISLFKKGVASQMILSGYASGFFDFTVYTPALTEAEAMKRYAVSHGVPAKSIIKEEQAKDTIGNAFFVKKILKKKRWARIIVVTNHLHRKRASKVFNKMLGPTCHVGIAAVVTLSSPFLMAKSFFYEKEMAFFTNHSPVMLSDMTDQETERFLRKHP